MLGSVVGKALEAGVKGIWRDSDGGFQPPRSVVLYPRADGNLSGRVFSSAPGDKQAKS